MCINPTLLPNGVLRYCRQCWQCAGNRINDWVGRCIAESRTAAATSSVTLTYRPEPGERRASDPPEAFLEGARIGSTDRNLKAQFLTYSDVQRFFKRLRNSGYRFRYIVVGEYGKLKGRAHWHAVIFWEGAVPPHELRTHFNETHWWAGHSYWDDSSEAALRYCVKYIQKDRGDRAAQGEFHMSKYPPLGSAYFAELAGRYVDQGLAPQDASYSFGDVRKKKSGKPVLFWLRGASRNVFLQSFLDQWAARRGGHPPPSPFLEEWCDRQALSSTTFVMPQRFIPLAAPWVAPPGGAPMTFSESHNTYCCMVDGERLFWSFDESGERAWRNRIVLESEADRLRAACARRESPGIYRNAQDPRL